MPNPNSLSPADKLFDSLIFISLHRPCLNEKKNTLIYTRVRFPNLHVMNANWQTAATTGGAF